MWDISGTLSVGGTRAMALFGFTPKSGWGSRSQIDAAIGQLEDLKSQGGNDDRLIRNEHLAKDEVGGRYAGNPLLAKARAFAGPGLSTNDEVERLEKFLATKETQWGRPVTNLDLGKIKDGHLWAATKAIELERIGRTPEQVTEGFVRAAGGVGAEKIETRNIFWQRFKPDADKASGKVVVMSPGFKETGENFYEQIAMLNAKGHDVIVMDHQWGGMSDGDAGGLDSLFGAARDVAAMTAHAATVLKDEYGDHPGREVMLYGNSMGAAAAFAATTMGDNGLIDLEGAPPMPKGVRMMLQSPFFGATPTAFNKAATFAAEKPFLNAITRAPLYDVGAPPLNDKAIVKQKTNQGIVEADIRAQLKTMGAANAHLKIVLDMVEGGMGPTGEVHIVHGRGDTLADFDKARWVAHQLGEKAELQPLETKNHVIEQDPEFQAFGPAGLQRLVENKMASAPLPEQTNVERMPLSWVDNLSNVLFDKVAKSPIGWLADNPPAATDATSSFQSIYANAAKGVDVLPPAAKQCKYMMVPGLFTERYPGYMDENVKALEGQGLDVQRIGIDTDASVEVNAKAIRQAILEASEDGSQVVLVGHSKGGVDATAALSLYPELKSKVRGVVSMQAPYGGTPIASDIAACPELLPHVKSFIKRVFGGDPKSLIDLSYATRQSFLEAHPYPSDVPTVCLATSSSHPLSLTAAASRYVLQRYGEPSDGLVPKKDAIIPGSKYVAIDDLDHAGPAMAAPACLRSYEPGALTVSLVSMLF